MRPIINYWLDWWDLEHCHISVYYDTWRIEPAKLSSLPMMGLITHISCRDSTISLSQIFALGLTSCYTRLKSRINCEQFNLVMMVCRKHSILPLMVFLTNCHKVSTLVPVQWQNLPPLNLLDKVRRCSYVCLILSATVDSYFSFLVKQFGTKYFFIKIITWK